MTIRPTFRQVDLARVLKAAAAAGLEVGRVEIDPATGKIVIVTAKEAPTPQTDFDKWKAGHAR